MQVYTGFLVSHVLTSASYYGPQDMFSPGGKILEHSQQRPLDVDLFCEFRWRDDEPPTRPPVWEEPGAAEVWLVSRFEAQHSSHRAL